ncbi:lantibiotic dehydratase [Umezawaea sp. Da 62-37]|uniref:lantibiotic dehydratase n=1 Tax=Umezawaea sp. Da 62-37 TaxID=3075927 RepID=UPI0028F737AF|nr:lantibiotic dehydratase [Umezawaea sp. Da 62-37]WNV85041.1 lantibiotic dehydratase [Umezawaea sp. Da 62-37]
MFTVIDAALLRMASRPLTDDQSWPTLDGDHVTEWRNWISEVWKDTAFARAVETASPTLARRVNTIRAGTEQRPRIVRGTVTSVLRYRLRATGRATPFGLFAGVAPTTFGPATTVKLGENHRVTTRVDAVWLADLITTLERCPELAQRLPVMMNNAAFLRDDRLVISVRQDPSAGHNDPAEVSIRHTRAIEMIGHAARTPVGRHDLVDQLRAAFPDTPDETISLVLDQLVEQQVLISALRPPMTTADPLTHVLGVLADLRADDIPAVADLLTDLRDPEHHNPDRPHSTDLRVDAEVVLPRIVAAEAARAAEVLARLTPRPSGKPIWLDYHRRFLERYGIGAAVPLLDLVNPDAGLGFPAGYRGSLHPISTATDKDRDTALLRLAHTAALGRTVGIALDDEALTALCVDTTAQTQWPPHLELAVRIHAASVDALDRGDFTLIVTGAFRAAGTTSGRFLDLLDPADRDRMTAAYTELPTINHDALRVQVSCPPVYLDTENVARSPTILPDLLSISEHHSDTDGGAVLNPDDLLVVGDAHRFHLWSRSLNRPVEPSVFNAVEFTNATHPLLRFVCELPAARTAAWGAFAWGIAAELPFLPRLTYRRTILSLARWKPTSGDLPGPDTSDTEWTAGLAAWRTRMMTPAVVTLGGNDQRIRLNLDEPAHRHLLRAHLDRHGQATLHEAPSSDQLGWFGGHTHEIIVPLARTTAPTRPPLRTRTTRAIQISTDDEHVPGAGHWVHCKLYGNPDRHTTLLTQHLPRLLSTLDERSWWFLPYRDPDDHLRLRIRLAEPAEYGAVTAHIGAWAKDLRNRRLITAFQFDTYRPETGRFGHGTAMTAAETVFAADSAATLAHRAHLAGPTAADPRALIAAGLVDLAVAFTGTTTGLEWLITHVNKDPIASPGRALHDEALRLAHPRDDYANIRGLRGGEHITAAWARRRTALADYRDVLTRETDLNPDAVLASLLHLHCVRVNGLGPVNERVAHRLARNAALSQIAHPGGKS